MPNLTARELALLAELMRQEQTVVKKPKHYAASCADPQLRTRFEQAAALHQTHYTTLYNQLN